MMINHSPVLQHKKLLNGFWIGLNVEETIECKTFKLDISMVSFAAHSFMF